MFRKLIKYSENSALILDKALLEALGIEANALVNIEISGKSLIIKSSQDNNSINNSIGKDNIKEKVENYSEDGPKIDFTILNNKYADAIKKINIIAQTDEFQKEVMFLADKYKDKTNSQEYFIAFTKLRYKYVPELKALDEKRKIIFKNK